MKKHHVDIMISEADVRSRTAELGAEITHFINKKAIDKLIVVGLYAVHLCSWLIWCVN